MLDQIGMKASIDRRSGKELLTPIAERLTILLQVVPSCVSTTKHVGAKRARMGLKEIRNLEKEMEEEETRFDTHV